MTLERIPNRMILSTPINVSCYIRNTWELNCIQQKKNLAPWEQLMKQMGDWDTQEKYKKSLWNIYLQVFFVSFYILLAFKAILLASFLT